MDADGGICINPECGEKITPVKGAFPKFCPACGSKIPQKSEVPSEKPDVLNCRTCKRELERLKTGDLPKFCVHCGQSTSTEEEIQTVTCLECGEIIKKNLRGKFPRYCPGCDDPVVVPSKEESMRKCPKCGHSNTRNRKGMFPNHCRECDSVLAATSGGGKFLTF